MSVFMDECRAAMRSRHLAYRTEKSYLHWIKRFILFHNKQHPELLGEVDVTRFLNYLSVERNCSPSTQSQALSALVFLYRYVIERPLIDLNGISFAKKKSRVPVVLSHDEVSAILSTLNGIDHLLVSLMYGSGLRVSEAISLRIKDVDFSNKCLTIRMSKGSKDRVVTLANSLHEALALQIEKSRELHRTDVLNGHGFKPTPYALRRKLGTALRLTGWQFVFPSSVLSAIPDTGELVRFHRHPDNIRKSISAATRKVGISKRVTSHTFRHSFATHMLQAGADIRTVQEQLGHTDVKTTEIYTHVLNRSAMAVTSPLDRLNSRIQSAVPYSDQKKGRL